MLDILKIRGSNGALGGRAAFDFDWPIFGLVSDVRSMVARTVASGQSVILGTLVHLDGGGPRPLGTQMAFTDDEVAGFFSGGCIEADLALHAKQVLANGEKHRVIYGHGSPYFDIRLLCGVSVAIVLERLSPLDPATQRMLELTGQRLPFIWVSDGTDRCCVADDDIPERRFADAVSQARHCGELAGETGEQYWVRYRPRPRLFVSGRDPSALALAGLASQMDIETTLIRENGPSAAPLGGLEHYWRGSAAAAFDSIGVDARTAIVAANHDFDADHDVLVAALRTDAAYVGAIGSLRYRDARIERLRAAGLTDAQLTKLEPICGAFHAKTPWEMAISVLAQLLPKFSSGDGEAGHRTEERQAKPIGD